MQGPHRARAYRLSIGQVDEWLVWSRLAATSLGDLHVFLPLRDEGIDGIVHRISTDQYARVQVKGRRLNPLHKRIVVLVTEQELQDDHAVILAVEVDRPGLALGPTALLVDVPTYRRLADVTAPGGRVFYVSRVHLPPRAGDLWAPWCLGVDELGDRLLPPAGVAGVVPKWPPGQAWKTFVRVGYRAEMELLRRAADEPRLNMFKAFPDLEPNEYLAYDLESRGILGIQVKAVTMGEAGKGSLNVHMASLRPSPSTWFVVFVAEDSDSAFDEVCAVIPSTVIAEHLGGDGTDGQLVIRKGFHGEMEEWRVPLPMLGPRLAEVASSLA